MTLKAVLDQWGRTPEQRQAAMKIANDVNEYVRANWDDPSFRREMAAVLTESILEGFTHETFYDQIVTVERVGFNDRVFLEEETGLKVFFIAKGGNIEASSMTQEVMEIPRDTLAFHVYEFEDSMEANYAKNAATLRNLAVQRLDAGVTIQMKNLIQAAISSGSPYYVSGAGLGKPALDQAIREVRDESQTGQVTIFGRSPMVDQIVDFPGYADEALEEIRLRGRLGVYRGATIIQARNWKDEEGVEYVPANELYVVASDSAKFAMYGGLKTKEYVEDDNWYWHYLGRQDFGGVVHRPERIRRIVDTSITP